MFTFFLKAFIFFYKFLLLSVRLRKAHHWMNNCPKNYVWRTPNRTEMTKNKLCTYAEDKDACGVNSSRIQISVPRREWEWNTKNYDRQTDKPTNQSNNGGPCEGLRMRFSGKIIYLKNNKVMLFLRITVWQFPFFLYQPGVGGTWLDRGELCSIPNSSSEFLMPSTDVNN